MDSPGSLFLQRFLPSSVARLSAADAVAVHAAVALPELAVLWFGYYGLLTQQLWLSTISFAGSLHGTNGQLVCGLDVGSLHAPVLLQFGVVADGHRPLNGHFYH